MRSTEFEDPKLFVARAQDLQLSGQALLDIMRAVLAKGAAFRFRALGWSMTPFIKNGDVITVKPFNNSQPGMGEIVAFIRPPDGKLVVHRIVNKVNTALYIQGDSVEDCYDGMIPFENILGWVSSIERNGHIVWLGLGVERYLIAWLSRSGLLMPLRARFASLKTSMFRRNASK